MISIEEGALVFIAFEYLFDGVDVGGRSDVEAEVVSKCRLQDALGRHLHDLLQSGVDNVPLRGSGDALPSRYGHYRVLKLVSNL